MKQPQIIGLVAALTWLLVALPAAAAPSGQAIAQHGNANGAPACSSCHGAKGAGNGAAGFPRLAGQPAGYLLAQLNDFASGARANAIMQPIAKSLSAAERQAVADYYAGLQTPSNASSNASDKTLAEGRELVVNGQWSKNIPACIACHGPDARGVAPTFPALAGQHAGYVVAQLQAWQKGKRSNDPNGLMKSVAVSMDSKQMKAAAAYLATLKATGPVSSRLHPTHAPAGADAQPGYFQPPLAKDLPKGDFGKAVRRGERIFTQTTRYASRYTGDSLQCVNCHVNKGRQANSAPMWAAWVLYPKYRGKNHRVNTMAERIRGCFTYSENAQGSKVGHAPKPGSQVLVDLQSYMYWLATGAPTGKKMKGQGYPKLDKPSQPYSRTRGARVFADNCAVCHGDHGQGTRVNGHYVFPPLWGPHSFNWGAGMHRVNTAAAFIKANMPLGKADSLTVQQAWDVAAFVDSHERPQDPRFNGSVQATAKKYHKHEGYYGKSVDGHVLGQGSKGG